MSYSKWDILLADVPFEGINESKVRPILVLKDGAHLIDCLKMTGQPPRQGEYVLKKWKEAGLHKETTVRISKRLNLQSCKAIKKIGHLHPADIIEIENRMS